MVFFSQVCLKPYLQEEFPSQQSGCQESSAIPARVRCESYSELSAKVGELKTDIHGKFLTLLKSSPVLVYIY